MDIKRKIMQKKYIIIMGISCLMIGLAVNLSTLKHLFAISPLADLYIKYIRDGADVDENHVITKLDNKMSIILNKHDRCVCWFTRLAGHWDNNERAVLHKIIKPGMQIIEIGANFGTHTLDMAGLVGNTGKIFAIEANPNIAKYLKQSVALNKLENMVQVFDIAVANKNYDSFIVYDDNNMGAGYILSESQNSQISCARQGIHCVPIQVRRLEELIGTQKIDLLKMDAEGSEYWILEGANSILSNPDITIMLEWSLEHMSRNSIATEDFVKKLQDYGFNAWTIGKKGVLSPISYDQLQNIAFADIVLSRDRNKF